MNVLNQKDNNRALKLSKRFKGLFLSDRVVNRINIAPPKDISEEENENGFLSNLYHNVIFHSKRNQDSKLLRDKMDENKYLSFLENSFNVFPLKKELYSMINKYIVPRYPSFFLFPLIYIVISDVDEEMDSKYKVLVLDEIKTAGTRSTESLDMSIELFGESNNAKDMTSEIVKKQSLYIGYKDLIQSTIKHGPENISDRPTLIRILNVINNMMTLELDNPCHIETFECLENELRIVSKTLSDRKWSYFFDRIRTNSNE